jgi:hypothetical protein
MKSRQPRSLAGPAAIGPAPQLAQLAQRTEIISSVLGPHLAFEGSMLRITIASSFLLGCIESGTPSTPAAPPPVTLSGRYQLASHLDLTSTGVLPDFASSTLQALSQLKTDPAGAIVNILESINAPIVSNVLSAIPHIVEQPLLNWIDDHVFGALYQGLPVTQQIAGMIQDIASLATAFQLDTTLDLADPNETGDATATHALAGMTFTVADHSLVVHAPDLVANVTQAQLDATALHIVEHSPDVENGLLDLHDHSIGLPLGAFVERAIDQLMMNKFGQPNLRAALGALINCGAIAHDVATKCIGPVCVGHEAAIASLCDAGLDAIAAEVKTQLEKITINALHFHDGEAKMWDAPMAGGPTDGVIDRLDDGTWTLGIGVGGGETATTADFTGTRVAPTGPQ